MIIRSFFLFLFLFTINIYSEGNSDKKLNQLEEKTDSPRETLKTFLSAMNDYKTGLDNNDEDLLDRIEVAIQCLNLEDVPTIFKKEKGKETVIFLKEVIDRLVWIDFNKIPEHIDSRGNPVNRWKLGSTEIMIARVDSGDKIGDYLFSKTTVEKARSMYLKVQHLPYISSTVNGAGYKSPIILSITPKWSRKIILDLYLWQWLGLLISIPVAYIIKYFISLFVRFGFKLFKSQIRNINNSSRSISIPIGYCAGSGFLYYGLQYLQVEGDLFGLFSMLIQIIFSYSLIWFIYNVINFIKQIVVHNYYGHDENFQKHLLPHFVNAIKLLSIIAGVIITLSNLGFNVSSVLAGLGIGGLAFALAAKDTVANLFGSVMILLDKPFKIGDYIILGEQHGIVEQIGMRSTSIRTPSNSVIIIPNADVANARINNMGLREMKKVEVNLKFGFDTSYNSINQYLQKIRMMLNGEKFLHKDKTEVYLSDITETGLSINISFFIKIDDINESEIKERIFLSLLSTAEEFEIKLTTQANRR